MGIFSKDKDFADIMVGYNKVISDLEDLAKRRATTAAEANEEISQLAAERDDAMVDQRQAETVAANLRAMSSGNVRLVTDNADAA